MEVHSADWGTLPQAGSQDRHGCACAQQIQLNRDS